MIPSPFSDVSQRLEWHWKVMQMLRYLLQVDTNGIGSYGACFEMSTFGSPLPSVRC
jgi:hypothetical protein